MGLVPCHIGLFFGEVPSVRSLSHAYGVPAPFGKGAFLRPVSFYGAISGFFKLSIDSVGTKQSQNPQTQTGAGASDYHLEPKRRVNPGWFLPGDS